MWIQNFFDQENFESVVLRLRRCRSVTLCITLNTGAHTRLCVCPKSRCTRGHACGLLHGVAPTEPRTTTRGPRTTCVCRRQTVTCAPAWAHIAARCCGAHGYCRWRAPICCPRRMVVLSVLRPAVPTVAAHVAAAPPDPAAATSVAASPPSPMAHTVGAAAPTTAAATP